MSTRQRKKSPSKTEASIQSREEAIRILTGSSALIPLPTTTAKLSTISYFLSFLLNVLNITKIQTEVMVNTESSLLTVGIHFKREFLL